MSKTIATYDEAAPGYDGNRSHPYWALWDHLTWKAVAACLPDPPARILDAGAGTGIFSLRLLERGFEVVLLDPSSGMLEKAREKVKSRGLSERAEFVEERLDDMSVFGGQSFDFVFSDGDPLSYCIGSEEAAAKEILRVLRPGGGFYVSCDNRWTAVLVQTARGRLDGARVTAESGDCTDPYGNPVHAFTPEELRDLFLRAGAEDVRVTGKIAFSHLLKPEVVQHVLGEGSPHKEDFLRYEETLAESPYGAALASHLQVTGRRPDLDG